MEVKVVKGTYMGKQFGLFKVSWEIGKFLLSRMSTTCMHAQELYRPLETPCLLFPASLFSPMRACIPFLSFPSLGAMIALPPPFIFKMHRVYGERERKTWQETAALLAYSFVGLTGFRNAFQQNKTWETKVW